MGFYQLALKFMQIHVMQLKINRHSVQTSLVREIGWNLYQAFMYLRSLGYCSLVDILRPGLDSYKDQCRNEKYVFKPKQYAYRTFQ